MLTALVCWISQALKRLVMAVLWVLLVMVFLLVVLVPASVWTEGVPSSDASPGRDASAARKGRGAPTTGASSAAPSSPPKQAPPAMWRPSFPALPVGTWDDKAKRSVLDYSEVDETSLRLANQINAAAFPEHACRLGESSSLAALETASEVYANCLLDAWRPWLAKHGSQDPKRIVLLHCARAERSKERSCRQGDSFFGRATPDNRIFLASRATPGRYGSLAIEFTIAHEVAHNLQFQVRPRSGGERALILGIADADGARLSRRTELQVECMSVAMVGKSSQRSGVYQQALDEVFTSDAEHWDRPRHLFWTKQATKDRVGECNATLATDDLVAYKGTG
ncbi:hypothetical protein AAEX63_13895 [Luteococcus sp. H138]|uniref:hypothetical protein n=1 Tax=unclassified Luteococcus TaxID=2639923 RepID=UPI00313BB58B